MQLLCREIAMEEQSCPRCKTTKYRNPNLKLLVNVCGHSLCENCVELLFVRGSGSCPECGIALRRTNFRLQLFEDAYVEKEVDIRKRVLRDYNKKESDFATLRDYNDYLEDVESIVFNLSNGVDLEDTKRRMDLYKKENQDLIKKNRSKLSRDEAMIEELLELQKQEVEEAKQQALEQKLKDQTDKLKQRDALIDELMFSSLPADHILATHKREVKAKEKEKEVEEERQRKKPTKFSTGIKMGRHGEYEPAPVAVEVECYEYIPLVLDSAGPRAPDEEEIEQIGYLRFMRGSSKADLGGGFEAKIACQRAIQEAFGGLFLSASDAPQQPSPGNLSLMDTS